MDDSYFVLFATIGWLIVWFGSDWSLDAGGVVISLLLGKSSYWISALPFLPTVSTNTEHPKQCG
ncbi:MAG: hypothetical protein O3C21_07795 [Verrucomicrobia bacterium]|nr:hypothetical protein [Verrucomicrobiota bacterium]